MEYLKRDVDALSAVGGTGLLRQPTVSGLAEMHCGACLLRSGLAFGLSWYAILWILGFGLFRQDRKRAFAVFAAVGACYAVKGLAVPSLFTISYFGVFLAIPLLLLYNGTHGTRSRALQYGFYWFYPAHLLVIWWISLLLQTP